MEDQPIRYQPQDMDFPEVEYCTYTLIWPVSFTNEIYVFTQKLVNHRKHIFDEFKQKHGRKQFLIHSYFGFWKEKLSF